MLFDISRKLIHGMTVWPGDTPYTLERTMAITAGDSVNLTTLTMSAHSGSHIDAPLHYEAMGASIAEFSLVPFWGLAQVVSVTRDSGPLLPTDFENYDLRLAPRLLVRSPLSDRVDDGFPERYVFPSPQLADYLGLIGMLLYGTDAPSMDAADSKTLDGHKALAKNGVAILEWLDLSQVKDGLYELVALPLKIAGGDGSPVRAALRTIDESAPQLPGISQHIEDEDLLDIQDEAG